MSKTETIQFRVDHDLKNKTAEIFKKIGINTTQAIIMFLKQVDMNQGLPFEVKIPNQETKNELREVNEMSLGKIKKTLLSFDK